MGAGRLRWWLNGSLESRREEYTKKQRSRSLNLELWKVPLESILPRLWKIPADDLSFLPRLREAQIQCIAPGYSTRVTLQQEFRLSHGH